VPYTQGVRLDRDSDIPLGVQLGWALRSRIAERSPGDRLPGVREVAADAGVNINTARAAYAKLEAEGLIRIEHGRGTFVAERDPADDRMAGATRRALREDIARLERELAAEVAARAVRDRGPGSLPSGGRILGEDELLAQRAELMVRLRELRHPAPSTPRASSSVTRPGVAWKLSLRPS
jgi:GntR family transcriptional regulator